MKPASRLILSTSPPAQPGGKPPGLPALRCRKRLPCRGLRYRPVVKELDAETGLYYYGARYLDPKTSRWLSGDPAMGEYIPSAPVNDEAKKQNQNLPGMGGVFNHVNLHAYHYAGNNPVKYVDPNGKTATYSVDDENKTITINVNIIIYGKDATNEIAQEYKKGIEDAWGGTWLTDVNGEHYFVSINVNVSVGTTPNRYKFILNFALGTENNVKADDSITRSSVTAGFWGSWRTQGRNGSTLASDNPATHEFGHLLGFKDRYTDSGGAMPGWEGNIMAEPAMHGIVEQRNIDAMSGYITQPLMPKNGVLRLWEMMY